MERLSTRTRPAHPETRENGRGILRSFPTIDEAGGGAREVLRYLRLLWPDGLPPGCELTLWSPIPGGSWHPATLEEAARLHAEVEADLVRRDARDRDGKPASCYLGMGAVRAGLGPHARGGAADVGALPALWADLDTADGAHDRDDLPTREDALEVLLRVFPDELRPSLVLDSGGGFYPVWLLDEVLVLEEEDDRRTASALLKGIQAVLRGALGLHLDGTANLDRVLRAAGAVNRKPEYHGHRVAVVHVEGGDEPRRYSASHLAEWIDVLPRDYGSTRSAASAPLDPDQLPIEVPPHVKAAAFALGRVRVAHVPDSEGRERVAALVLTGACPVCESERGVVKTGRAHVSPRSGALRCKSANCRANEGDGGLELEEWASLFLDEATCSEVLNARPIRLGTTPVEPLRVWSMTLEQARNGGTKEVLLEAERLALEGTDSRRRRIVLVQQPVGAGKTHALAELVAANELRESPTVHTPNHRLASQLGALSGDSGAFHHVFGATSACVHKAALEKYGDALRPRRMLCGTCEERPTCKAHALLPGIGTPLLAAHASDETLARPLVSDPFTETRYSPNADRVLWYDEGRKTTRAHKTTRALLLAARERWTPHDPSADHGETLRDAAALAVGLLDECKRRAQAGELETEFDLARVRGEQLLDALLEVGRKMHLENLRALLRRAGKLTTGKFWRPGEEALRQAAADLEDIPTPETFALFRVLGELLRGRGVGVEVIAPKNEAPACYVVRERHAIPRPKANARGNRDLGVVVLDATAAHTVEEVQAANPDDEVVLLDVRVEAAPEARLRRVLYLSRSWSRKGTLRGGKPIEDGTGRDVRPKLRAVLRDVVAKWATERGIDPGAIRVGILTHGPIAERLRTSPRFRAVVERGSGGVVIDPALVGHYGLDERGSNAFEDCDVLVTLGDPLPNLGELEGEARVLGMDPATLRDRRAAATLEQAFGRVRPLDARGQFGERLLVHAGTMLPPTAEDFEVRIPANRGRLAAKATREQAVEALAEAVLEGLPVSRNEVALALAEEGAFGVARITDNPLYHSTSGGSRKLNRRQYADAEQLLESVREALSARGTEALLAPLHTGRRGKPPLVLRLASMTEEEAAERLLRHAEPPPRLARARSGPEAAALAELLELTAAAVVGALDRRGATLEVVALSPGLPPLSGEERRFAVALAADRRAELRRLMLAG